MGDALTLAENGCTEAPASLNIRYRLCGYDCMLTLRDSSGRDLLAKLSPVLDALDGMGATPNVGHQNGNGHAETKPCPVHPGEMLVKHAKNGQTWWSHQLADGTWCRGGDAARRVRSSAIATVGDTA